MFYALSDSYEILKEIDVEKYFSTSYAEREIKENFNFEIFKNLEGDVFTKEEKNKLENLQMRINFLY